MLYIKYCNVKNTLSYKVAGIRLGEHNTLTDPDCDRYGYCAEPVQDFVPKLIIAHEDYNKPVFKNDIAIIRLNKPAVYNGEYINKSILINKLINR